MMMFKYSILCGNKHQPAGISEEYFGAINATDFDTAVTRLMQYYNNYIITSIRLVKIDDVIELTDVKEL